jgi:hypothetical protein
VKKHGLAKFGHFLSKYQEFLFSSRAKTPRRKGLIKKISWRIYSFARGEKSSRIY